MEEMSILITNEAKRYKVIINKVLDSQMNYITISYGGLLSRNAFCVEADFNFYY